MKHMKKLGAMVLAVMMLLSLAITASAAETYSVTINNAEGHTYQIYQIFTGDLSEKDGKDVLSNIKYGADYHPGDIVAGEEVPEDVLNNFNPANVVLDGEGQVMTTAGDVATIEGLVAGYYMIVDVTAEDNLPDGQAHSAVIFQVVEDTEITSKHPTTTIEKKVEDINDTTGEYTKDQDTWIDSADYDIGDVVPFKSTANFDGLSNYETYKVIFTDTMAKGLRYNGDMKVYINDSETSLPADAFTVTTANYAGNDEDYVGGTVITVTINDIIPLLPEGADTAKIVLKYTATLNEDANLGAPGNHNKIKVSTKPDGTGETPEDVNVVFTFKVEVDKYTKDAEGNKVPLVGAGFTLYKEVVSPAGYDEDEVKTGAAIKAELAAKDPSIKADALKDGAYYIVAAEVEVSADGATFSFEGIDDGTYVLVETTIPEGYNAWDAEEFVVEATHDVTADDPALKTLTGGDLFTGYVNTGILETDVENKSGVILPETGGMGTTVFYIAGALMVLVAVVLLVTKKRMATAE